MARVLPRLLCVSLSALALLTAAWACRPEARRSAALAKALGSGDALAIAKAAHAAASEGRSELAPALIACLSEGAAVDWPRRVAQAYILDALVRLSATVPMALLEAHSRRDPEAIHQGALFVLANRCGERARPFMRRVLASARPSPDAPHTQVNATQLAAAMWLVQHRDPYAAGLLLRYLKVQLHLHVCDDGSSGSSCLGGAGFGFFPRCPPPRWCRPSFEWPPHPWYVIDNVRYSRSVPLISDGTQTVWFERWTSPATGRWPRGALVGAFAWRALKTLVASRPLRLAPLYQRVHTASDGRTLQEAADLLHNTFGQDRTALLDALEARGLLEGVERSAVLSDASVTVHDARRDIGVPLPAVIQPTPTVR